MSAMTNFQDSIRRWFTRDTWTLSLSLAALLVSVVAVYLSARQTNIMEATGTRQIRAYVVLRTLPEIWAIKGSPETFIWFKNAGQTPAGELTLHGAIRISERAPNDNEFEKIPPSKINDALEQSAEIQDPVIIQFGRALTPDEIERLKIGALKFYVWGVVTYVDVFDALHRTYFCYSFHGHAVYADIEPAVNRGVRAGNRAFCSHPKSN
jgi:hypothetical protein